MDIALENMTLTQNQVDRIGEVSYPGLKGMSYSPSKQRVVLVTERAFSEEEKAEVRGVITALSDIPIKRKTERERILDALGLTEDDLSKIKNLGG